LLPGTSAGVADPLGSLLNAIQPHHRAAEVALCRAILRIPLHGSDEEAARKIVLPARKENEAHLSQSNCILRFQSQCRVELGAGGREITLLARKAREENVRSRRVRIVSYSFCELAASLLALPGFHGVDACAHSISAAAAREEIAADCEKEYDRDCYQRPHRNCRHPTAPRLRGHQGLFDVGTT
jgi:hypothetical protein